MQKTLAIISFDEQAGHFYAELVNSLFGEYVTTACYSVTGGNLGAMRPADLFVVSNDAFESGEALRESIPEGMETVEVGVTFTKEAVERLKKEPRGKRAFFVNLSDKMVREAITQLSQLGINHLDLIPYYPGSPIPPGELPQDVTLAITPCENRFAPRHVTEVIDLGHRIFDSITVVEMAVRLKLDFLLGTERFRSYFERIAAHRYSLDELYGRSMRLESRFEILTELFDEGIIGVNEDNRVFACNSKAVEITGVNRNLVLDAVVGELFPEIPFEECRKTQRRIDSRLIKLQDRDVNVAVVPVIKGETYTGALAMIQRFDEQETKQQRLRIQLLGKGHTARYSFDDILGHSKPIRHAVTIARKMAGGDSSILITGESGTGKELFAQAIHQASPRARQPFIAINCAAMPDTLLESELFGYEEGAFTGAKKGGKQGLFEFAHLGTLFLDEVEGMSPALQVRLLRVIQEKEVMRVGGNQLIRVNVRIIAACNENLENLVAEGKFRRDLYFRLNTLPVRLPPLRERGQDIIELLEQFRCELGAAFSLSPEARDALLTHTWPGNIRELRNYAEWFSYLDKEHIEHGDLPPGFFSRLAAAAPLTESDRLETESFRRMTGSRHAEYLFVLRALGDACDNGPKSMGRDTLLRLAEAERLPLSQREVRGILAHMDTMGLIKVYRGRGGSRITPDGLRLLRALGGHKGEAHAAA